MIGLPARSRRHVRPARRHDPARRRHASWKHLVTEAAERGFTARMLDGIERVGNKVPHPALIFAGLCVLVIVVSAALALCDVSATYEVAEPPPVSAPESEVGGS